MWIAMTKLDTRKLLAESAPVAVILAFWALLADFVPALIETGLLVTGVVMALFYVVSRGVILRGDYGQSERPTDLDETLRENVQVALPAGVWFLAAFLLVSIGRQLLLLTYRFTGLNVVDVVPVDAFAFAFTGAGIAVALLYAIVIGLPAARDGASTGATPAGTGDDD